MKRQKWVSSHLAAVFAVLLLIVSVDARADKTVLLVRHAEKAKGQGKDPELTEAGKQRAAALVVALEHLRLDAVLSTDYKRTRNTAAPIVVAHGLTTTIVGVSGGLEAHAHGVAETIHGRPDGDTILVVGHSNTLAPIIAALGGPQLPDLADYEHETLFVLLLPDKGEPHLIRGRYGAPDPRP